MDMKSIKQLKTKLKDGIMFLVNLDQYKDLDETDTVDVLNMVEDMLMTTGKDKK